MARWWIARSQTAPARTRRWRIGNRVRVPRGQPRSLPHQIDVLRGAGLRGLELGGCVACGNLFFWQPVPTDSSGANSRSFDRCRAAETGLRLGRGRHPASPGNPARDTSGAKRWNGHHLGRRSHWTRGLTNQLRRLRDAGSRQTPGDLGEHLIDRGITRAGVSAGRGIGRRRTAAPLSGGGKPRPRCRSGRPHLPARRGGGRLRRTRASGRCPRRCLQRHILKPP